MTDQRDAGRDPQERCCDRTPDKVCGHYYDSQGYGHCCVCGHDRECHEVKR